MTSESKKWSKIPSRTTVSSFILLLNSLTGYYMTLRILLTTFQKDTVALLAYYVAILISSFASLYFANKFERTRWLYLWMSLSVLASFLALFLLSISPDLSLIAFFIVGLSFGVGMPSCLAYFANSTTFENRGIRAGVVFLLTIFLMPFVATLLESITFQMAFITLGIWYGGWLLFLVLLKIPKSEVQNKSDVSFKKILENRSFAFYLIPWLMFNFIDQFEASLLNPFFKSFFGFTIPRFGAFIAGIVALIGGYFSDLIGRKRVIIYGFISLGTGYAIIGIATTQLWAWYFYIVMEGITWGIFYVNFVLVIWGDLAYSAEKEKYYFLGSIPFFSAGIMGIILAPVVVSISPTAAFSLASIFLFIAILPLIYVVETLPEKKIKERQLKKYVEEAKKVAERKSEEKNT